VENLHKVMLHIIFTHASITSSKREKKNKIEKKKQDREKKKTK
jgi:hypothetical protein